MAVKIISYKDAKAKGLKRYFTGKPCKHGHISERMVSHCGCIACAYNRTRIWNEENLELKAASFRNWQKRNAQYFSNWNKNNKESRRTTTRNWYLANREHAVQVSLNWAKKNPEKARARCRNRHAVKRAASGAHTGDEVLEMLRRQKWKCVYCRVSIKGKRHIDHIMPLALGGSNDIKNLQGLCPTCNCAKNAKHPLEWAKEIGFLI